MRSILISTCLAAAAFAALPAQDAHATTVLADIRDGYVNAANRLEGSWKAEFAGGVGNNTATLDGTFKVKGGAWADWFGGVGNRTSISANLSNFSSSVTGTQGIYTQPQFDGNIFAEAVSYPNSSSSWNPDHYIRFEFDELFIQGVNGAYLAAGRGSSGGTGVGKIYNYYGELKVNFWMNNLTFNAPDGTQYNFGTGDWITVVVGHTVTPGDPVPEPTTWAMLAMGALGVGWWLRRRRGVPVESALV